MTTGFSMNTLVQCKDDQEVAEVLDALRGAGWLVATTDDELVVKTNMPNPLVQEHSAKMGRSKD